MKCDCGEEMNEIWRLLLGDSCSDGCCQSYAVLYQCPKCKTIKVKQ